MPIHIHRVITWLTAWVAVIGVTACTSLEEFKTWTPERRAAHVCKNRSDLQGLRQQQRALEEGIARAQTALSRGYHLHTQCRHLVVPGPLIERCVTAKRDKDQQPQRICALVPSERLVNDCTDTAVPLVAELEKEKIQHWTASLAQSRDQESAIYATCTQHVMHMTPEQAYSQR
jgi:hypothetical protein